jgi:diguanylate cyclase (GGDEF)-like protein
MACDFISFIGGVAVASATFLPVCGFLAHRSRDHAHKAAHDDLTDLLLRAPFEKALDREIKRKKRQGHRVVVMFIDLNDLKPINDTHGHKAGDIALRTLASVLDESTRETDIVARLSGDEFAVLLTDTQTLSHVYDVYERCVSELERRRAELSDGQHGLLTTLSFSCGIGVYDPVRHPEVDISAPRILITADKAMYKAKTQKSSLPRGTSSYALLSVC